MEFSKDASRLSLALVVAWVLHQPGIPGALVGARTAQQATENARAGRLALDPAEVMAIADAFATVTINKRPGRAE